MSNRNGPTTSDFSDAMIAMLTGAPSNNTRQNGSGWFGPWRPLPPAAPPQVKGREWDFRTGYNLAVRTRAYEGLPFHLIKNLARYDVVAMAIETRKDQMARLPWSIVPRKDAAGKPVAQVADADIERVTQFFRRPDGRHAWGTWLRMLCHEQMETDTASIYPHRAVGPDYGDGIGGRGGELIALELIDGTTMKPIIDDYGRVPIGPDVAAYQQILHGLPAVDYTSDDLIYMPRNPRVGKVYGFSPVEQIATTVDIAFRRQEFQKQYFTAGNIPDAIATTPEDWTVDQVRDLQEYWDAILAGSIEQRSGRIKFMPGGPGFAFHQLKDPELSGKFDEFLIRHVCFAFSLPPTPFINQVNRATAESAHDAALEEGLAPLQAWAKEHLDFVLATYFPDVPVEFAWADDREVDGLTQSQILTGYVSKGVYTINESRDVLGLDAVEGGDVPMVLTANGYVRIDVNADAPTAGEAADQKATQAQAMADAAAKAPAAQPGQQPTDKPAPQEEPAAKTFRGQPRELRKSYWTEKDPHRHARPQRPRGDGGRAAPDGKADA